MIHLRYHCLPSHEHPDAERTGDTWFLAWIRVRSFAEAEALAKAELERAHWDIVEREEIFRVPRNYCTPDDPHYAYYQEALQHREVYAYYLSPKYPSYCVELEAVATARQCRYPPGTKAHVLYWVVNSTLAPEEECFDDFWGKGRNVRAARTRAAEQVERSGWRVRRTLAHYPTNCHQYEPDSLVAAHYDEAEEIGECLAFWPEAAAENTLH
jgi:hypothetical protein